MVATKRLIELETQIAKDRNRYAITPVRLHQCPTWAQRRLDAVLGIRSIHNLDIVPGPRLIDHWGESPSGSLVLEPFATIDDARLTEKVEIIASALGVRYSIGHTLTSWYLPGKTIRIELFESSDSKPLDQLRSEAKAAMKIGETLLGIKLDRFAIV